MREAGAWWVTPDGPVTAGTCVWYKLEGEGWVPWLRIVDLGGDMGLGAVAAREFRRGDYVAVYGLGCRVLGEIENPRVAAEWQRMQASQGRYEARYTMRVTGMGWVDGRGSLCLAHMINAEITGHGGWRAAGQRGAAQPTVSLSCARFTHFRLRDLELTPRIRI